MTRCDHPWLERERTLTTAERMALQCIAVLAHGVGQQGMTLTDHWIGTNAEVAWHAVVRALEGETLDENDDTVMHGAYGRAWDAIGVAMLEAGDSAH